MDYKKALELKNAGFPQGLTEHQYGWIEAHKDFELDNGDMTIGVSAPTLEELIEACGGKMVVIKSIDVIPRGNPLITTNELTYTAYRPKVFLYQDENYKWSAFDGEPYSDGFIELPEIESYDTPTEAVANLWLEINKKA